MESKEEDYIPFGPEWEAEVKKWPKQMIIELFRKSALECIDLKQKIAGWDAASDELVVNHNNN